MKSQSMFSWQTVIRPNVDERLFHLDFSTVSGLQILCQQCVLDKGVDVINQKEQGKAVLVGFFSTIGDIECLQLVEKWLQSINFAYDVVPYHDDIVLHIKNAKPKDTVTPSDYSHIIVICGPCSRQILYNVGFRLSQFNHCFKIGINLSMLEPLDAWNPFDLLLERDSGRTSRPDLSLLGQSEKKIIVGLCFIEKQPEYAGKEMHAEVIETVTNYCQENSLSTINIDTRWPSHRNKHGYGSSDEIIAATRGVDVIITNRLHGLVFALKMGTPVIAIDGIMGGAKVTDQAKALNWPALISAADVSKASLEKWFQWCTSDEAPLQIEKTKLHLELDEHSIRNDLLTPLRSNAQTTKVLPAEPVKKKRKKNRLFKKIKAFIRRS